MKPIYKKLIEYILNKFLKNKSNTASDFHESSDHALCEEIKNCPFCEIAKTDINNRLLAETNHAFLIKDKSPATAGHSLIISKSHKQSIFNLDSEEFLGMFYLLKSAEKLLGEEYSPDGYTIGVNNGRAAGQSVMHVHLHVIPRYAQQHEDPHGGIRGVIPGKGRY